MSINSLWRLAGVSALVGGALFALTDVLSLFGTAELETDDFVRWALLAIGCAFGLGGLLGVYGVQIEQTGVLGLAGFVLSLLGLLLVFGFAWGGVVIVPEIVDSSFIRNGPERAVGSVILEARLPLLAIGLLVLGLGTLRAGVLSKIGAWLLIAGAVTGALSSLGVVNVLDPFGEQALGGLGFAWLGWSVVRNAGTVPSDG